MLADVSRKMVIHNLIFKLLILLINSKLLITITLKFLGDNMTTFTTLFINRRYRCE